MPSGHAQGRQVSVSDTVTEVSQAPVETSALRRDRRRTAVSDERDGSVTA
jgi:hypothetical protein